ncbi:MAG: acyl-CoA dehydrogenase [Hyphomicrobiaceae bacterium]|nr:acyl-CoA dehydrogenase [Hyphomicrobiaceae bacterium]
MTYAVPLRDIRLTLDSVGLAGITALPGFEETEPDLVESILGEAAKVAENTLAPLNRVGDTNGARMADGKVVVSPGWTEAWQSLVEGGWNGVSASAESGGMGLPELLGFAISEMWQSANMAFALCPMLTQGAVNAVRVYGSESLRTRYLPRMVSGEWTGTMNLTEPQAGSDLAAVRTRAVPEGNHYRISGQKIFITYGDHEMTDNIVHLVLARIPDAPPGVKGLSLFLVPKRLLEADGSPGAMNDVACASLEHKLGIHGSPTAVLVFGEQGGAWGELVGEPNRGLEYMFAMMNHARLNVGLQGLAIGERAYQQAVAYARERVQGKPIGHTGDAKAGIIGHPEVRRTLASMKARIEAMRGLLYEVAAAHDIAHVHPDEAVRSAAQRKVDLLTPIAKGWCTETGNAIASEGLQVHGGMGYVEETGAAQHFRDARITTIYEGTTAIQANDLVGRKLIRDNGRAMMEYLDTVAAAGTELAADELLSGIGQGLVVAARQVREAVAWILDAAKRDARLPYVAAVPLLNLMGLLAGAHAIARTARAARAFVPANDEDGYYAARIALARLYVEHILPQAAGHWAAIRFGSEAVLDVPEAHL